MLPAVENLKGEIAPRELWEREKPCLLLALGNDILGDDAVGHLVAREAANRLDPEKVDVVETGEAGLALLEQLAGYQKAVLVDAYETADHPAGSILEYGLCDFREVVAPSPHYAGLPEVFALAARLRLPMPAELTVVAVAVRGPFAFGQKMTPAVSAAVPEAAGRVARLLRE
jgi:hydrogenase maturation protease